VRIVDAPTKRESPGEGPVTVQVRTPAAVYGETVSYAPGHPKNPLSWERLGAKYQTCARQGGFSEAIVVSSLEMVSRIDEIGNVRELLQLFAASDSPAGTTK
jgi:2-methylcitrate dehydratase PrpD